MNTEAKNLSRDPVFRNPDNGKWYFWNETWSDESLPYETEEDCRADLKRYAASLESPFYAGGRGMTLSEMQTNVGKWADEKGWWTPQCSHTMVVHLGRHNWCKLCGGLFDNDTETWDLTDLAQQRNDGELMLLMVTEIAEAFEEIRNHHQPDEVYYNVAGGESPRHIVSSQDAKAPFNPASKPEGVPVELADVVIRILDYCAHKSVDLEGEIVRKMIYNQSRPYRHGGKAS